MSRRFTAGSALFGIAGLMFVLYPALRPYSDETSMAGATAFASDRWVIAHICAMVGFIAVTLALRELHTRVIGTIAERPARFAVVTAWVGIGLTLPYYGAEAFALHALGQRAIAEGNAELLSLADPIRFDIFAMTMFGVGLLMLAVGAIAGAVTIARATENRWLGVPFALAFSMFIPQFYVDPALRVAHGVLVLAGCAVMALALGRLNTARHDTADQLSSTTTGA